MAPLSEMFFFIVGWILRRNYPLIGSETRVLLGGRNKSISTISCQRHAGVICHQGRCDNRQKFVEFFSLFFQLGIIFVPQLC